MRVLITGANGHIGKSLCKNLSEKYESVTCLTRSDLDLLDGCKVKEYLKDKYFDVVIHCAVVGGRRTNKDGWDVMDQNLMMYYNLLSCRSSYNKFIHFGSGAEIQYENTPYGNSKSTIRKSILNIENFYNIRIYGLFDENELSSRFIKANITNYVNRNPIIVYQDRLMDFFYMEDLIKIVSYYIENNNLQKEIDCVYDQKISLLNLAEIINSLSDYKVNVNIQQPSDKDSDYIGVYQHLPIEFLGLEKGITKTYNKLKTILRY